MKSLNKIISRIKQLFTGTLAFKGTHVPEKMSSATSSLIGILKNSDLDEEDYKHYLEDKYL